MKRFVLLALPLGAAALAAIALLLGGSGSSKASHGNFEVHVHDDYYHPVGAFIVGSATDHGLAQIACQVADPIPECDALIHVGDSVTWVAPPPLSANLHTVTECTDNSFSVCGPAVDPDNPIGDSGVRNPPDPGPSQWPYGPVQFDTPGVFYYRCEVHPDVMRGRVVVLADQVGGIVDQTTTGESVRAESAGSGSSSLAIALAIAAVALVMGGAAWYAGRRLRRGRTLG